MKRTYQTLPILLVLSIFLNVLLVPNTGYSQDENRALSPEYRLRTLQLKQELLQNFEQCEGFMIEKQQGNNVSNQIHSNIVEICKNIQGIIEVAGYEYCYKMASDYKSSGDRFYSPAGNSLAKTFYQRYMLIAQCMLGHSSDPNLQSELQIVQKRLEGWENITFIVLPTSIPQPTPTWIPIPVNRDERLKRLKEKIEKTEQLKQYWEEYETLKEQEKQGSNLDSEIVSVLQNMITVLEELKDIYTQLFQDYPAEYQQLQEYCEKELADK